MASSRMSQQPGCSMGQPAAAMKPKLPLQVRLPGGGDHKNGLTRSMSMPSTPQVDMQIRLEELSSEPADTEVPRILRSMSGESPSKISCGIQSGGHNTPNTALDSVLRYFPVTTDITSFLMYVVDLAFRSIPWFRFWWWTVRVGFRTCVWTKMLLPVMLRYAAAYFRDPRVCRRVPFGKTPREFLDIYVPPEASLAQRGLGPKVPVVVALMGGGFVVGHRSYNAQLGLRCADCGVMLVCIDYRNFPFAQIPDMVENVSRGIRWVFQNIESFGGDVSNMLLAGQSAGAHLAASALLHHCLLEAKHIQGVAGPKTEAFDVWSVKQFKSFVGVSGPYDISAMAPHLGLPPRVIEFLTVGDNNSCSPGHLVSSEEWQQVGECAASLLPTMHLFHGATDLLVPASASATFAEQLRAAGVPRVVLDVRPGINHTYPVIEGPILRHDIQLEVMLPMLLGEGANSRLATTAGGTKAMWPPSVVKFAAWLSPFGELSLADARR